MADVINLRLARKARARAEAVAKAGTNRARFGASKAERAAARAEAERTARTVDGARRERDPE